MRTNLVGQLLNWAIALVVFGIAASYARAPLEDALQLRYAQTAVAIGHVTQQHVVTGPAGTRTFVLDYDFQPEGAAAQSSSAEVYQDDYARLRTGAPVNVRYLISDPAINDVDENAHADERLIFPGGVLLAGLIGAWLVRRWGGPIRPQGWARIG